MEWRDGGGGRECQLIWEDDGPMGRGIYLVRLQLSWLFEGIIIVAQVISRHTQPDVTCCVQFGAGEQGWKLLQTGLVECGS